MISVARCTSKARSRAPKYRGSWSAIRGSGWGGQGGNKRAASLVSHPVAHIRRHAPNSKDGQDLLNKGGSPCDLHHSGLFSSFYFYFRGRTRRGLDVLLAQTYTPRSNLDPWGLYLGKVGMPVVKTPMSASRIAKMLLRCCGQALSCYLGLLKTRRDFIRWMHCLE